MILDNVTVEAFLTEVYRDFGYAHESPTYTTELGLKSFQSGYSKTIDAENSLFYQDLWAGRQGSGGMSVVNLNGKPLLLIQFHGGCAPWVEEGEVTQVNSFLRDALAFNEEFARLPSIARVGRKVISHESGEYVYFGAGFGNIFDFRWVEIILRKTQRQVQRNPLIGNSATRLYFRNLSESGFERVNLRHRLVFYHILSHQHCY